MFPMVLVQIELPQSNITTGHVEGCHIYFMSPWQSRTTRSEYVLHCSWPTERTHVWHILLAPSYRHLIANTNKTPSPWPMSFVKNPNLMHAVSGTDNSNKTGHFVFLPLNWMYKFGFAKHDLCRNSSVWHNPKQLSLHVLKRAMLLWFSTDRGS